MKLVPLLFVAIAVSLGVADALKHVCNATEIAGECQEVSAPVCAQVRKTFGNNCVVCTTGEKWYRYWNGMCKSITGKWTTPLKYKCTPDEIAGNCEFKYNFVCVIKQLQFNNLCLACKGQKSIRYEDGECPA